jgi:signal transduction histidine kinase
MSQLPESNSSQQTHSGSGHNVSRDKNDTSYFSEIGGDFKGIQGDISGGVINQYIITQKSGLQIISQRLITGSPYLGLRKFEVDDKDKFFGRDRWIIELTNYLAKENVLFLLGASGSGKSSLIQAGLIPKLKDQWGSQLFNFTFVPDVDPFESFYGCLLTKYKQSEAKLARMVKEDTLIQVVQSLKNDAQWLIFIDQFEEVFTRTPKTERDIFIKSLIQLIKNSDSSVKVIMTMRADFLDKLSPYPDLGKVHDSSSRMLTDMEDSDLRLAIAEPAARNGVIFEQGLIDTIIADFKQQAGSLPLLQYTLNLLWSKDDITDRVLNTKTYQELGGVTGALQQQANKIYDQFDETQRKLAEEIFLELIELVGKEAVSRRADKGIFERDETQKEVLYQLIDNRLLVSKGEDGKATVEVAHEELIRSWKVLQDLIREKEEIIVLRNRLYLDAKQWNEIRKKDSQEAINELWSGSKLARIVEFKKDQVLPNLDGVAIEFIEASKERQKLINLREESQQLREDISNMIVHDLRHPLSAMILSAGIIKKYCDNPNNKANLIKKADQIITSGKRQQKMIDSLLLMAKLEAGKILFNPVPTDLHELGAAIITDFELTANAQMIELKGELPPPGNKVEIDAAIVQQMIENLISNAIKFSPAHSQVTLTLEYLADNHLRIKVADQGSGINQEQQKQIFENF